MYNFVHYLSYTASVMILVVNCVERYVAIMCPFRAKTILSHRNLVVSLAVVWASSGVYCCPRLLYFRAGAHELPGGQYEIICLADRELYDSQTFDTINFLLLYVMPLTVISILYWRIGRYLWVNGRQIEEAKTYSYHRNSQSPATPHTLTPRHPPKTPCHATHQSCHPPQPNCHAATPGHTTPCQQASQSPCCITAMKDDILQKDTPRSREERSRSGISGGVGVGGGANGVGGGGAGVEAHHHSAGGHSSSSHGCYFTTHRRRRWRQPGDMPLGPYHSERLISTWRKVVKLLVAVVSCFALCNLPFHLRKMLTYYHPAYNHTTDAALMFTPLSYLLMYLNSALNPILYSFMSHNFRACVRDVLTRYTRKGKRRHPSVTHNPHHRHAHTNPPPSLHAHTNPLQPSLHAHTNPPPSNPPPSNPHAHTNPPQPTLHTQTNPTQPTLHNQTNPPQPTLHNQTNPTQPNPHAHTNPPQPTLHNQTNPPQPTLHAHTNPPQPTLHNQTNPPQPTLHAHTNPPQPTLHTQTNPTQPNPHTHTNPPQPNPHAHTNPPQPNPHTHTNPTQPNPHTHTNPSPDNNPQQTESHQ
ncbi:hypothetical protein Pmani_035692 [Petrolisthes manimaculis]|uniref:G-protein coupled receptors family 1 profile domain-containing protein n=1 Tax=Petrolisthes manimaculis TaxID=1843537 RepID=A0AAE1TQ92_9EUCA|nr:hypothetical protein Pmani_035692 [Petrolisthes manimaculis]